MKKVVLLKSVCGDGDASDPYVNIIQKCVPSSEVIVLETLQFQYLPGVAQSTFTNDWRSRYSGVVFTSPRALVAFSQANLKGQSDDLCFCVGPSTAAMAEHCGFTPLGSEMGNADALADFIINNHLQKLKEKPLLFLCGKLRRDTLPTKLKEAGIEVKDVVIYSTIENPELDRNLRETFKIEPKPVVLVFFSPSGVDGVKDFLISEQNEVGKSFKIVAMGPTTANHLKSKGYQVHNESSSPRPQALADCVKAVL